MFCGITTIGPDPERYKTLKELIDATAQALHGVASADGPPSAVVYQQVEQLVLQRAHIDSFPAEYALLSVGKPVPVSSRLIMDTALGLIRVGGRLCRAEELDPSVVHPVVLDPQGVTTRQIRDFDDRLHHPGPEYILTEFRCSFWNFCGRE